MLCFFCLMLQLPPRSTRTDTLFPYTTLFRSGTFDFVLIDLWKDLYIPCLDRLHPKLAAGGMILADNMIFPPENEENAQAYRRHVRSLGDFDSVLLPIGAGVDLSRRQTGKIGRVSCRERLCQYL